MSWVWSVGFHMSSKSWLITKLLIIDTITLTGSLVFRPENEPTGISTCKTWKKRDQIPIYFTEMELCFTRTNGRDYFKPDHSSV